MPYKNENVNCKCIVTISESQDTDILSQGKLKIPRKVIFDKGFYQLKLTYSK